MKASDLDSIVGDESTVYSGLGPQDVLIRHAIPYMIGVWSPPKEEIKKGAKPIVFYASKSLNRGFKKKGKQIKFDAVQYSTVEELFIKTSEDANEGHRGAFRYLNNIQRVAMRCVTDCKAMLDSNVINKKQFEYMEKYLDMLIEDCQDTLRLHKEILHHEGKSLVGLSISPREESGKSQRFRMARALRLLIKVGAVASKGAK
jgi:hypothetical protein